MVVDCNEHFYVCDDCMRIRLLHNATYWTILNLVISIAFEFYTWIPMSLELRSMTLLQRCWVPILGLFLKRTWKLYVLFPDLLQYTAFIFCYSYTTLQYNMLVKRINLCYNVMSLFYIIMWIFSYNCKKWLINWNKYSINLMLYLGMGWRACSGCTKACWSMYICTWLLKM